MLTDTSQLSPEGVARLNKRLGTILRSFREEAGITQGDLAYVISTKYLEGRVWRASDISRMETGQRALTPYYVALVCGALQIPQSMYYQRATFEASMLERISATNISE